MAESEAKVKKPRKSRAKPKDDGPPKLTAPRKAYNPIHFEVAKVTLVDTGETVGALIPLDDVALRACRERGMTTGSQWKMDAKRVRNLAQWRFAHLLGGWLADNHEMFIGLGAHAALKKLQMKSGIGCDSLRWKLEGFTAVIYQPLSLAFDVMDEGEFRSYWDGGQEARGNGGWLGWMRTHLYAGMDAPTVDELEFMITGERVEWH